MEKILEDGNSSPISILARGFMNKKLKLKNKPIPYKTIMKNKKLDDFKDKFEMELVDDESVADK